MPCRLNSMAFEVSALAVGPCWLIPMAMDFSKHFECVH